MESCQICKSDFKRRLLNNKPRGYFKRGMNSTLRNEEMTVFEAAKKMMAYKVAYYSACYVI